VIDSLQLNKLGAVHLIDEWSIQRANCCLYSVTVYDWMSDQSIPLERKGGCYRFDSMLYA